MQLQIVSDLHLEFSSIEINNVGGTDVLVLSGDICVADYLTRKSPSPYSVIGDRFREFFDQVSFQFPRVYYILGNHEHYRGSFEDTTIIIRRELPDNVILLNNEFDDYQGYRFIGGTLWTDFNKNDPIATLTVENGLNDYHLIKKRYRKLRGIDTYREHKKFLEFIHENVISNTVVLGHHAPSWKSVSPQYANRSNFYLNSGYVSALEPFIMDHPDIKLWTHGHVHSSHDYMIEDTRIIANPRGYQKTIDLPPENRDFDPNKVFII